MNNNQTKVKKLSHYNPIRFIVGSYKGKDKDFLGSNEKVLTKLLRNFKQNS